ncbi:MAG: hypothetical protein OSA23_00700 [Rhodospirillales bacterium]|nr:hypothetical protein [Rhodospirillales bacterium]
MMKARLLRTAPPQSSGLQVFTADVSSPPIIISAKDRAVSCAGSQSLTILPKRRIDTFVRASVFLPNGAKYIK